MGEAEETYLGEDLGVPLVMCDTTSDWLSPGDLEMQGKKGKMLMIKGKKTFTSW